MNSNRGNPSEFQRILSLFSAVGLFLVVSACATPELERSELKQKQLGLVRVTSIDFQPRDGNWLQMNGQQEWYDVVVTIDGAPEEFDWVLAAKEDRSWQRDPTFSRFPVHFLAGHEEGLGSFWLRCTDNGNLRGNVGRDNDGRAKIYLESLGLVSNVSSEINRWTLDNVAPRVEHTVTCVDPGASSGVPPPQSCATRNECGEGQWCVNGQCQQPPISQYCTPRRGCGDTGICEAVRNNPTKPGGLELLGDCDAGTMNLPNVECICLLY